MNGSWVRRFVGAWVLVLGFVVPAFPGEARAPQAPAPSGRSLVIPFENVSRDPRGYWLTEGSAIILTDDLIGLHQAVLTRDDRLRAFDRLRIPNVPTLSHATMIRLGQVVGAGQIVLGSFELRDDVLTVRARTIRLDTGRISADIAEVGSLSDVFGVFAHVAQRLVPESRVPIEEMEQVHPPFAAFEQYVKGLLAQAPSAKESFLKQALKIAPGYERARLALWDVYTDQSKFREALTAVRAVPADSRFSRQARFLASLSLISLTQYQEAFDILEELNRAMPDSALLNNLGVVQLRRASAGGGTRAVSFFGDAARLDGNDSDLFFNLGYAYWLERDLAAAVSWLREAVRRNPADDQAHYILGAALQSTGSIAEGAREKELAKRLSSVFTEWETKQPAAPIPRGLERIKTDVDVPAALRVENVIVASGQRDQQEVAASRLARARRLAETERDAEAIAELRRVIYLTPYQSDAHLLLGQIYLRDGRATDAVDELKISVWSADTLAGRLALAEAYLAAKNPEAARTELQTVLAKEPDNARAKTLAAQLP